MIVEGDCYYSYTFVATSPDATGGNATLSVTGHRRPRRRRRGLPEAGELPVLGLGLLQGAGRRRRGPAGRLRGLHHLLAAPPRPARRSRVARRPAPRHPPRHAERDGRGPRRRAARPAPRGRARLLRPRRARSSPTPSTTGSCASCRRSRPSTRRCAPPTRRPSRSAGRPPAAFSKVAHREPMLSLANAMSDEELAEFDERIHRLLGLAAEAAVGLRLRAEARRPGGGAGLRGRPPRPRLDPRRRRHRRGHHRQPADHRPAGRPTGAFRAAARRRPGPARGPRRGAHAPKADFEP